MALGETLPRAEPSVAGSRVRYPEPLAVYASRFSAADDAVDERTLKRWISRGRYEDDSSKRERVPLDLPPFHRPAELLAWCERRLVNRPPAWVLRVSAVPAEPPAASPHAEPSSAPPADAPAPEAPRDQRALTPLDFEANVHQLRLSLALDQRLLDEAKSAAQPDEALVTRRQRSYRDTYDLLRKSESDLLAWREQNGRLAPFDEVRAENTRVATSIFGAVLRLVRNIRPKLAGQSPADQDRIWEDAARACFIALRDARFTDAAFLSAPITDHRSPITDPSPA